MEKRCVQCGQVKPLEGGFYRSKRYSDGADTYCKACRDGRTRARVIAKRAERPAKPARTEKLCARCREAKPLADFYSDGKGGYGSYCRPCNSIRHAYYAARPEVAAKLREQDRNRRSKSWTRPPRRQPIADGFEVCTMCNEDKPFDQFHAHKLGRNGMDSMCRDCKRVLARERNKDPEVQVRSHRRQIATRFGVDYDELLVSQNGVCAICSGVNKNGIRLHVDHCHTSGRVRGLLCYNCNTGLGVFKDNPELLSAAIGYLQKNREKE